MNTALVHHCTGIKSAVIRCNRGDGEGVWGDSHPGGVLQVGRIPGSIHIPGMINNLHLPKFTEHPGRVTSRQGKKWRILDHRACENKLSVKLVSVKV